MAFGVLLSVPRCCLGWQPQQRANAAGRKDAETELLSPTGEKQELDSYFGASCAEVRAGSEYSTLTRVHRVSAVASLRSS